MLKTMFKKRFDNLDLPVQTNFEMSVYQVVGQFVCQTVCGANYLKSTLLSGLQSNSVQMRNNCHSVKFLIYFSHLKLKSTGLLALDLLCVVWVLIYLQ